MKLTVEDIKCMFTVWILDSNEVSAVIVPRTMTDLILAGLFLPFRTNRWRILQDENLDKIPNVFDRLTGAGSVAYSFPDVLQQQTQRKRSFVQFNGNF